MITILCGLKIRQEDADTLQHDLNVYLRGLVCGTGFFFYCDKNKIVRIHRFEDQFLYHEHDE